jgi:hypothetical protein
MIRSQTQTAASTEPEIGHRSLGADSVMLFPDSNGREQVIKLRAYAAGDLDGDGYGDLFAKGAFGVYVFYGGPEELQGMLGADRASAQLPPGFGNNTYGIRDFDGDGLDDIVVGAGPALNIVYGSKQRLIGMQVDRLLPDLVVKAPADDSITLLMSASGDIDGDDAPELIIAARTLVAPSDKDTASTKLLYTVRGKGSRLTGVLQVTAAEVRTLATRVTQSDACCNRRGYFHLEARCAGLRKNCAAAHGPE